MGLKACRWVDFCTKLVDDRGQLFGSHDVKVVDEWWAEEDKEPKFAFGPVYFHTSRSRFILLLIMDLIVKQSLNTFR